MLIRPFTSLRLAQNIVAHSSCPPYDVITRDEARKAIKENPCSFLRVTRSDGELPENIDQHSDAVYERARENLEDFLAKGALQGEPEPCLYIYQQVESNGHSQTGVVACVSVDEYREGIIKVHEKTRPEKVEDRTRHMLATGLHAEPVFLAFKADACIWEMIEEEGGSEALYDFTSEDNVRHLLWKIKAPEKYVSAFADIPYAYIADGHHRAESAKECADRISDESSRYFLAVLFPHDQLRILAYNRVIRRLPDGESSESILEKIIRGFDVVKTSLTSPAAPGSFCMFIQDAWYLLKPRAEVVNPSPVEALDVSVLSSGILKPVFGIVDERRDSKIDFVGGSHGPRKLEEIVRGGEAVCAFSMYPVTIDQLFAVAGAGSLMPPKSTWFEPKLRSGLFVHEFLPKVVPGRE